MSNDMLIPEATVAEIGKLPAEVKDTARAQLAKVYPAAEIERAFGAQGTAAPAASPHAPSPKVAVANSPDHALSYEQRQSGIEALRKHWTGTPEEFERALTGGDDANPAGQDKAPINPTLDPPSSPSDYRIKFEPGTIRDIPPAEFAAFMAETKAAFHAAGVPAALAQGLASAIERATNFYEGLDPQKHALAFREEGAKLRRAYGEAGAKEIAELASAAYSRLPETYRAMLDEHHALHSAQAQVTLANIERAYRARRSKS